MEVDILEFIKEKVESEMKLMDMIATSTTRKTEVKYIIYLSVIGWMEEMKKRKGFRKRKRNRCKQVFRKL
jgi:hypothetical protein